MKEFVIIIHCETAKGFKEQLEWLLNDVKRCPKTYDELRVDETINSAENDTSVSRND